MKEAMNQELIEYHWNEISQTGEFTYESPSGELTTSSKAQPLTVETPRVEAYWGELIWYLKTQGGA